MTENKQEEKKQETAPVFPLVCGGLIVGALLIPCLLAAGAALLITSIPEAKD